MCTYVQKQTELEALSQLPNQASDHQTSLSMMINDDKRTVIIYQLGWVWRIFFFDFFFIYFYFIYLFFFFFFIFFLFFFFFFFGGGGGGGSLVETLPCWGDQNIISSSIGGGGVCHKIKCQFLGIGVIGCILVKCCWLPPPITPNINMCYIYGCHFIISLFYLL